MSIHTLTERAMVMNLSISLWQGYRRDKEASRQITEMNGAVADAAGVNKHLIPKEHLAPVVSAAGAVRTHFYDKTLPWRDNGDRLMTRKLYMPFIEEHEKLVGEFTRATDTFLEDRYPSAIEKAAFRMGSLHNPNDYPSVAYLRHRFRIHLEIDALTTSNDFRVQIDQAHVDRVRSDMEAAAERRAQSAMQDVWRRLAETVGRFSERLATPDAVFRDSLISNVSELIELIPGLNVLDDPNIEAIRKQVEATLVGYEAKDIRKDPALRAELAGGAKDVMDKMAGFMKAFGAGNV